MLVRVFDSTIVLVFKLVVFAVGIGIATVPERFDKLLTLFFVGELFEGLALLVGNDPAHVFVQPLAVLRAHQLFPQRLRMFLLALGIGNSLEGIARGVQGCIIGLGFVLSRFGRRLISLVIRLENERADPDHREQQSVNK